MDDSIANQLEESANLHLAGILESLPNSPAERFILFVEVVRAIDYWSIHAYPESINSAEVKQSLDLMYWGWNRAVAALFVPVDKPAAFPMLESTEKTRSVALGLMQELGKVSLTHRLAKMCGIGILEVEKDGDQFKIRMNENARAQHSDAMESERLEEAQARVASQSLGWTMISMRDAMRAPTTPGNYLALPGDSLKRWCKPEIEELIKPLVRPWDTGRGVMVEYDARIEVDKHYMAKALALATIWRRSAGIHSQAKFGDFTGAHLAGIAAALISLHAKHFGCVSVAKRLFPEVSVGQSLTIWGPRDELEESIAIVSGSSKSVVHAVFNVLAMTSEQAKRLAEESTPLIPLIFDLGNGFILRPISSMTRNPFNAARTQLQWLEPRTEHAVAADRERWMREDLYNLFAGNRYIRFPGNLKLRRNGVPLTDIDAAIYDRLTGCVGLFQLKWQDYTTNDVRRLRSKAANLSAELMDWSSRVTSWIEDSGTSALAASLRLKRKRSEAIRRVLLFAISESVSRTQGYGVKTEAPELAIATGPQFSRVRMEVGASERPLCDIHARLIQEYEAEPDLDPMPAVIRLAGITLVIQDFWNRLKT